MPLRKRIGISGGWPLECLAGLEPASLRYATQRDTSYTIGTISRCFAAYPLLLVES